VVLETVLEVRVKVTVELETKAAQRPKATSQ
jgi:hypothetical protein